MKKTLAVLLSIGALTLFSAAPAFATGNGHGHTPVTICHATSSEKYVTITVDDDSVKYRGHLSHEDDLIPAPAGGCSVPAVTEPPVILCEDGEEVSNGMCVPADEACPGQDECPPAVVSVTTPTTRVAPPVVVKNVLHEAKTDGYNLASTRLNAWPLEIGALVLLTGVGLMARRKVV